MKGNQVGALDVGNGRVLCRIAIGGVLAVNEVFEFALHDGTGIVVASRDATPRLSLGKIELVLAERRLRRDFLEKRQHFIKIFLQAIETDAGKLLTDAGFDAGRHALELCVQVVRRPFFGAAASHHRAHHAAEAGLLHRLQQVARADEHRAAGQRQLMVFKDQNAHPVGQSELFDLWQLQCLQRRVLERLVDRNHLCHGQACKDQADCC